ncbi:MAG: aldo/keto reductase [Tepidisphaeraceae bacterium]
MSEKIRWGLLGTGSIAHCLAENLPQSRTGTLVAVGSRTPESAKKFADKYDVKTVHGSYEALLADANVDAVYVSTPHPGHAEWAIKALRAGKHVLCEKPMALNAPQVTAMLDAAAESGKTLMEAFMYRCHPQTAELLKLIREKAIGDVKLIVASFGFTCGFNAESRLWSNDLAGGGLMDVGCYPVSMARLIAGAAVGQPFSHPTQITGTGVLAETGVDAVAAATLKFDGGIVAQVSTALVVTPSNDLTIYGTEGRIHVPNPWVADRAKPVDGKIVVTNKVGVKEITVPAAVSTYAMEIDAFGDAILAKQQQATSPAMTWDDSLSQARTLDAWRQAAGVVYKQETPEGYPATTVTGAILTHGNVIPKGKVAGLDKPVSRLVLGCDNQMTFPTMAVIADAFFEAGGNAFDTAYIYGGGVMEKLLGQWMKTRGVQKDCAVVVKGAHTPNCFPGPLSRQLVESLERLQLSTADMYVMHRDNTEVPVGEFIDVLNEHVSAGRIKVFGGSNWSLERIQAANEYAKKNNKQGFGVVSNQFSLARMVDAPWAGCISAGEDVQREWFTESQTSLFPWSSQAMGFFVDGRAAPEKKTEPMLVRCWYSDENFKRLERAKELAKKRGVPTVQIALAYVLGQPFPTFPLIGPRTVAELRSSLPGLKIQLTPDEIKWLDLRA